MKRKWSARRTALKAGPRKASQKAKRLATTREERMLRKSIRAEMRPGLERDTQLMPWLIAETVCEEVSRFLDLELPVRYAVWLEAKAELCYAGRRRFYKLMRGRGNAPRDWLYAFMRHWLGSILQLERRDLCRRLPMSFALGERLPRGTDAGVKKLGTIGDCRAERRDWDPSRVIRHH